MKALALLKSEIMQILHKRKLLIAIIGVMTIPVLYSGTYLWAFWDPYAHLDRMPVAIVNNDEGATYNGQKLTIGKDLVKNLKKKDSFNWHFVNANRAKEGLKQQDYYLEIEIPKDFSKNATTLQSDHPKKLELIYTVNEGYNYLSSKIGDSAVEKIKEEVSNSVTKTYAESMFNNLKDVAKGLNKASDGAGDLYKGIGDAKDGAGKLAEGITSAKSGTDQLTNGAKSVQTGAQTMEQKLEVLAEKSTELLAGANKAEAVGKQISNGLDEATRNLPGLQNGAKQLSDGASKLSASIDKWKSGADKAKTGADSVNQGLQKLLDQVSTMENQTTDPIEKAKLGLLKDNLTQLSQGSQQVADGVGDLAGSTAKIKQGSDALAVGAVGLNQGQEKLATGLNRLSDGAKQLVSGQDQLTQGLGQFQNGTNKLVQGSKQLTDGTSRLYNGQKDLQNGITQLANGSADLTGGMGKLVDGSKQLSDQLHNGAKDANDIKANDRVYDMFAKPVNLKDERMNYVPNYGSGLAPYFLSLSLFVGALMLSVIFPMYKPAAEPKSGFSWFIGKTGIILAVGVGQALLADAVLLLGLGLEVKSIPYFIMLSTFTSWTFLAIIQFLVAALDNPGRFIAVIILILQLTGSAGTYPIELSPKFLQMITDYLPMTYTISGFRSVISTGDYSFMWNNIAHLGIFFMAFLAATFTFFTMKLKRLRKVEMA